MCSLYVCVCTYVVYTYTYVGREIKLLLNLGNRYTDDWYTFSFSVCLKIFLIKCCGVYLLKKLTDLKKNKNSTFKVPNNNSIS